MPDSSGEKTEQASPKKREDERKKGNIFMSKDITTVVSLFASFYIISYFVSGFVDRVQENYRLQMVRIIALESLTTDDMMNIFVEGVQLIGVSVVPALFLMGALTTAAVLLQTKFLVAVESLKFKLERIDPIKGAKRLISLRSLVELAKSLIKISVLTWVLYSRIRQSIAVIPAIFDWEVMQAASYIGKEILSLVVLVGIAFGAVSALDYMYQRWDYERNIKMTKQEVKEEYKQLEGNPEVKSARRQKQREFAQKRMMQQVQDADVIVRNPTHYAVALKYDFESDPAPKVLAKGVDHLALRIVEEAAKHDITTVENKPLARGLYELSEIDDFIPPEFYQPVAELLAWLYSTKEKEKGKS